MNEVSHFILTLKDYRNILPRQTLKTIRGQALAGDVAGAKKGLQKLIKERTMNHE